MRKVDAIWAGRLSRYSDDELRDVYRGSRAGEETDAEYAAMVELASRAVARKNPG